MARMIGRVGNWVWWLAGLFCAMLFDGANRAPSAEPPQPPYGVAPPPPPPVKQPAVTEEQKQQAKKLVADYLAPVPPAEPTAEQKTAIEKLVKDLGSADFKVREEASAGLIKQGTVALGALGEASKSADPEVATRAAAAVVAIERAAHQAQVDELKKMGAAGTMIISQELGDARKAWADVNAALQTAEKDKKAEEIEKGKAAVKAATEKMNALNGLMALVGPVRAPVYGVRAVYGIQAPQAAQ
jgi:hypothetical protein